MHATEQRTTQRIVPNIWFNGNAREAVDFYIEAFPQGRITHSTTYPETGLPDFQREMAGKDLAIQFELGGLQLGAINAGPEFSVNPSISFFVNFDPSRDPEAETHLNELWNTLIDGGTALIPLDAYPFSARYGWVQDRYNVSWQLILTDPTGEPRPFLLPSLLFGGMHQGQAEEALAYYVKTLQPSRVGHVERYPQQTGPAQTDDIVFADFTLADQWFAAMDSGVEQTFTFNEGISLAVSCRDQEEIDRLWAALSHDPAAEQCGWCRDQFGVSWQVVPENIDELLQRPGAYQHLLGMKKLVIDQF